jgi:hypothetical protein
LAKYGGASLRFSVLQFLLFSFLQFFRLKTSVIASATKQSAMFIPMPLRQVNVSLRGGTTKQSVILLPMPFLYVFSSAKIKRMFSYTNKIVKRGEGESQVK